MSDLYEPQPGDSEYVLSLKQRGRELAGLQAKFNPPPVRLTAEDQLYSLRNYDVEGGSEVVGPGAGNIVSMDSYAAAGVTEHDHIEFSRLAHLQPALARQLIDTVKAVKSRDPDPNLISGYTGDATSLADAETRRVNHVMEAKQALGSIGGVYADKLTKTLEKLPRAALDLLVTTATIKRRAAEERPK